MRSVYLDKTHGNGIAEGVQIFGVIHLRRRVCILVNWLKTPFFEPFREIFYVIYHNIYGADGKLHGITVKVILGRCFGNMHLGFAPHMDITLPDRALREKHTCGENGIKIRVLGKQVVGNIVNLIDFTTGVCNLCFKKHLRLVVIGKALTNLVGCSGCVV